MWNIIDWETSRAKAFMSLAEQGAYRNLLDQLYKAGGRLLHDERVLWRASGACSLGEWQGVAEAVMGEFGVTDDDAFIVHHRVTEQIERAKAGYQRLRKAGRVAGLASAKAKSRKRLSVNESLNDGATVVATAGNEIQPLTLPNLTLPNPTYKRNPKATPPNGVVPSWIPISSWDAYIEMRKKIRAPLTESGKKFAIKALDKLRGDGHDLGVVLEQSVMHSWRGLFQPKENGSGDKGKQARERGVRAVLAENAEEN